MLLCASATSLDDTAFFSFRIAFDVGGVSFAFAWSVNMGSFLFEMVALIFWDFSINLSALYER